MPPYSPLATRRRSGPTSYPSLCSYAPNGVAATDFAGDLSKLRGEMSAEQEEAWKKDADTELRKFDEEVWVRLQRNLLSPLSTLGSNGHPFL